MPTPNPWFNFYFTAYAMYLPLVFAFGASVASFLTVVMDRVPRGQSIVHPRSRCESCEKSLRWFENMPVVGYLALRGRCRHCKARIPFHLFLNELLFGLSFAAIFVLYFMIAQTAPFVSNLVAPGIMKLGLGAGWPIFFLHVAMLSALHAMTVIDLKTFTIPIEITWVVTVLALLVHLVMPIWPAGGVQLPLDGRTPNAAINLAQWTIPLASPVVFAACLGGVVGLALAWWLLHRGVLRHGFLDFDLHVGPEDAITDYPYPRREIMWEIDYLGIILAGMFIGGFVGSYWSHVTLPLWCGSIGGSLAGYFVGAGLIWGIRILGTLGFGKEAMGMGDAHLLGCVGAVVGWVDPILIFLLAPFLAIIGMIVSALLGSIFGGFQRILPYGPWLALATLLVLFGDHWLEPLLGYFMRADVNLP